MSDVRAPVTRAWLAVGALLAFSWASPASAQSVNVGEPLEDYLRLLQISGEASLGSFTLRPLIFRPGEEPIVVTEHPWSGSYALPSTGSSSGFSISPVYARLRAFVNSRQPMVHNDGAVWQGKGLTTAIDFGTTVRWRSVSLSVLPSLIYTQNADFELATVGVPNMPEYAYPWRRIDLPQRFGPDALWKLDPGQSELRVGIGGATVGFGTRNLWWGPGVRNAIVMSNNAAGIPHAFVGTRGPRSIGIGTVEANWIWGRLRQSGFFDPTVGNDDRFLTGLVVAYSPSFLDGLSVGLTRVFYGLVPEGGVPFSDLFLVLQGVRKQGLIDPTNPTGDDELDQLLSLFGRWVLPESGFEVYVEWARNDHAFNLTDFLLEPEHSQAYTLGLQKAIDLSGGRKLALRGEVTHLEREATFRVRASPVYYTHQFVTQGYTQGGQVIGAGLGPGGNGQYVGAELYAKWGRAGVVVQRRVHDNDAYYGWAAANGASFDKHDVSFDFGANALVFVGDFDVGGGLIVTRELNRYFYGPDVTNVNLSLTARWRPR